MPSIDDLDNDARKTIDELIEKCYIKNISYSIVYNDFLSLIEAGRKEYEKDNSGIDKLIPLDMDKYITLLLGFRKDAKEIVYSRIENKWYET